MNLINSSIYNGQAGVEMREKELGRGLENQINVPFIMWKLQLILTGREVDSL